MLGKLNTVQVECQQVADNLVPKENSSSYSLVRRKPLLEQQLSKQRRTNEGFQEPKFLARRAKRQKESEMATIKRRAVEGDGNIDRALPVSFTIPPPQEEQGSFMQLLLREENDAE